MSICANCRLALRQATRQRHHPRRALSTKSSAQQILSQPAWSIRSLLDASPNAPPPETITPSQLHHLLRLSALPLPKSAAEGESMIATLQSQLRFVRAVQGVDTDGVEPLRAIRDETDAATEESTVGLDALRGALEKETLVGHYQRPRRVREKVASDAEDWDVLSTASRKAGKYFVVQSGKKTEEEASG